MPDLSSAKSLLAKKPAAALASLIAVWRARRLPRLAELIDTLDAQADGALARAFAEPASISDWAKRVKKQAKLPADPRLTTALVGLLASMPYTSNGSRGMWETVFAALDELADPRVPAKVAAVQKTWQLRPLQREWLDEQVAELERPDAPKPTPAEEKQLAELEAALARSAPARSGGSDSLAAVYADPDDDRPRAVYADELLEKGDPRGELIQLQLNAAPTPAQLKRIQELIAKHERKWLGALEPIIAKEDVEWRRGFLAGCRVKLKNEMDVKRYGSDPSWATVEKIRFAGTRFSYQAFSSQSSGAFHVDPVMRSLRDVNVGTDEDLAQILAAPAPWPIERLAASTEADGFSAKSLDALAKTGRLPRLKSLEMYAPRRGWLGKAFFAKQLEEIVLGLRNTNDDVAGWVRELGKLKALKRATLIACRARGTYPRWTFERDAKQVLSVATLTPFAGRFEDAIEDLRALPVDTLTALTVRLPPGNRAMAAKIGKEAIAAVSPVAKRQKRLATLTIDIPGK
jgi:uncharacterized protein (TIGR02996 family)